MNYVSKFFRFFFRKWNSVLNFLRLIKLKLLYEGITIDFKTRIEKNCSIVCVKGGRITILNSTISYGTNIKADSKSSITINNSFIGRNCVITSKEKVIIKNNCLIAEMVVIRDQDHVADIFLENKSRDDFHIASIVIEENVWIASKATILKGVSIGKYSVVAASSVVSKDIPSFEVWAGVPAKFIKKIKSND